LGYWDLIQFFEVKKHLFSQLTAGLGSLWDGERKYLSIVDLFQ
jgi:hypothetical protein